MSQGNPTTAKVQRTDVVRDGDYLVVRRRWVDLPPACVVCGYAECRPLRIKIRRASKWCVFFGGLGILYYFVAPVALLNAHFCGYHHNRERIGRWIVRGMLIGTIPCFLAAIVYYPNLEVIVFSMVMLGLLLNFAPVVAIMRPKLLRAIHSDRHYIWLSGVSPSILDQVRDINAPAVELL